MPNIVFRFPAGRYHATPWGNHVNEGLVEWPPSPWRIVRALLATGFSKLAWKEPPPSARELVDALASVLPEYRLPRAVGAHTRHWMPKDSKNPEDRTKIFDAFAHIGRTAEIAVIWPVALSQEAAALLGELTSKLSYLGRAESVVEARVVSDAELPGGDVAFTSAVNVPGVEPIALLAPMTEGAYASWLAAAAPLDTLNPSRRSDKKTRLSPYPEDSFTAVLIDTAFLQKHGWTQPPGSRRVFYYRPPLSTFPPQRLSRIRAITNADTALLALASDTRNREVLPRMARGLPQAELLHMALLSKLGNADCPELTGRNALGAPLEGHRHAILVPLNLNHNDDGQIDHILVHARMGLGAEAQRAIRAVRATFTKGGNKPLFLTLVGLGKLDNFLHLGHRPVAELAAARVWVSRTPFVPPRHIKTRRHTLEDQVQSELASRGLPLASSIQVLGRDEVIALGFHRFIRARRDRRRAPPSPRFFGLRIELECAVCGPIALGYASHFGLGLMVPDPQMT